MLSGSYPLAGQIVAIPIRNSVPKSPIPIIRSDRHQTFSLYHIHIAPLIPLPRLIICSSAYSFNSAKSISGLPYLRFILSPLIYLIHGHSIVADSCRQFLSLRIFLLFRIPPNSTLVVICTYYYPSHFSLIISCLYLTPCLSLISPPPHLYSAIILHILLLRIFSKSLLHCTSFVV